MPKATTNVAQSKALYLTMWFAAITNLRWLRVFSCPNYYEDYSRKAVNTSTEKSHLRLLGGIVTNKVVI